MWYNIQNQQVKLFIIAKPNAKKTALVEVTEQGMHIRLHASPQEGQANKELISYLSDLLNTPKRQIILQRGEGSRHKVLVLPLTPSLKQLLDEIHRHYYQQAT
jgi:uncharacterized protein